jgi:7-cyano-7-deazaguanine synthase
MGETRKPTSVVLLSGGMDSTVAYYWALQNTIVQKIIWFEFGQKNAYWEAKAVCQIAPQRNIQSVKLPRIWLAKRKPARNMVFISAATVVASYRGADLIIGGWSAVDSPDFPDCSPEFLRAATVCASAALGRDIQIYSPVSQLNKKEIVTLGDGLWVEWSLTRSCYTASEEPCGVCTACKHRREALEYHGHSFS